MGTVASLIYPQYVRLKSGPTLAIVVVAVVALCTGGYMLARWSGMPIPFVSDSCRAFGDDDHIVRLKPSQLHNAATITAVGTQLGMPPRGITVALATAWQESELENLASGDRDSVGLFQQRPSQGWGTPQQLQQPRYASEKFYYGLQDVPGWESMAITDAAQAVQLSAHPTAYSKWEENARTLAHTLLGNTDAAVSCILRQGGGLAGSEALDTIQKEFAADRGFDVDASPQGDADITVTPSGEIRDGWQTAHWFVAKSRAWGIREVTYEGVQWTADSGKWAETDSSDKDHVAVHIVQ